MKAMIALIRREFLEHRGAFLYAPAILLATLFIALLAAFIFENTSEIYVRGHLIGASAIYELALAMSFGLWGFYLMVALFFYFADSFSADRRNNALLFWKSMPQSDFKVLGAKALSAITIFPALAFIFALITGLLAYLMITLIATRLPLFAPPTPLAALTNWALMAITGLSYLLLTILWYAPFLSFVAGLSTLFQRWSIPLAFAIPGAAIIAEYLISAGRGGASHPIANFLANRSHSLIDEGVLFKQVIEGNGDQSMIMLANLVGSINWTSMLAGLLFAIALVYLASEYRRRHIDA